MPKFAAQIDTMRIPVKGLVAEGGTAFPTTPVEGQHFHRTDLKQYFIYLDSTWRQCDNQGTAAATHIHAIADVTGLQAALDGKANTVHSHTISNVTGLQAALDGKASDLHTHDMSTITGLVDALDGKVPTSRQVSAGSGLTGGGDLTANRSLAVDFTTVQAKSTPLNQIAVPTLPVDFNSQRLQNVGTPTGTSDAVPRWYMESQMQGLSAKGAVKAATTANVSLSGTSVQIDGVTVSLGDRVLVKNQTTQSENGIYQVETGSWTRTPDADSAPRLKSAYVFVERGTVNANTGWLQTTDDILLENTALVWVQFSGAGQIDAGTGMSKSGSTLNVGGTANRIVANADTIDIASNYVGQTSITTLGTVTTGSWNATTIPIAKGGTGATTAAAARTGLGAAGVYKGTLGALAAGAWVSVSHNLSTSEPQVSFVEAASSEGVILDWKVSSVNAILVKSDVSLAASAIRISVVG